MSDTETKDSYGHVLKYTGIFGGVQGLNILMGLVRNKLVAVILGPSGMGLMALFNSTIAFISQATNLGISFSAVKHLSEVFDSGDMARMEHFIRVIRAWSLLTALFGMFVCMAVGPLFSDYTFSWGDHSLHFILLAPAVGLLAVTGGETAILKAARRLRPLAMIQIYSVFASLVVSVPVFLMFGQAGIVPVIVLMAFANMVFTVLYSYRFFPLRLRGSRGILGEGMQMVRLGVAFVLAGILGSGSEIVIRSYLNVCGDLDVVGLYNAGFMLTITYAGMVFSAMETDYFPRLSAVNHDVEAVNTTVNRQIEVSVLLLSPMLALFIIALPVLLPLLYSGRFIPVVAMAQVAVFSMYLKAVSLPVAYITLSKGDSVAYLILEGVFDVAQVLLVMFGYNQWGLTGTGIALSLAYLLDLIMIVVYARIRYHYVVSSHVCRYVLLQLPLGMAAYAVTFIADKWLYWALGFFVFAVSAVVSLGILYKKTSLWNKLKQKYLSK
ncbi:MAG: oligosaccharide flippase family protein [Prevotella sp.]|nr:oligosaccharide flippase family protein [Prevotella sp.]